MVTDAGMLLGTWAAAVAAGCAAGISYFVFRSQTEPQVVVYIIADPDRQGIINLIIENIGKGVAKNIRFTVSHPIPLHAFDNKPAVPMDRGPLVSGIASLGPGARRVITWGQYRGLLTALGTRIVSVKATYSADTITPWAPSEFTTESFVDVVSFDSTDISDSNYTKQIAKHLADLTQTVRHIAGGQRTVRIEVLGTSEQNVLTPSNPSDAIAQETVITAEDPTAK